MLRVKIKRTSSYLLTLCIFLLAFSSCTSKKSEPFLSPLSEATHWEQLEAFQNTLTREDFLNLIQNVYTQADIYKKYISIEADHAVIQKFKNNPQDQFTLYFTKAASAKKIMPKASKNRNERIANPGKPLSKIKIAIDPGHIGGAWAKDEGRWFKLGNYPPVAEGEISLTTSQILQKKLTDLGAEVFLVRSKLEPVSPLRPEVLHEAAEQSLKNRNQLESENRDETEKYSEAEINTESRVLAYRVAEIRERARLINEFAPDLSLVVHFNAEDWDDPEHPRIVDKNHLHLIVHGSYTPRELDYDDIRFEMLRKLLSGSHDSEMEISKSVAQTMKDATHLPPCIYPPGLNAKPMSPDGYLWARNLLANRLYHGPVIYLEPYVMNNAEVYQRLSMGDYEGKRWVAGKWQKSIFREYADGVVEGLLQYYQSKN